MHGEESRELDHAEGFLGALRLSALTLTVSCVFAVTAFAGTPGSLKQPSASHVALPQLRDSLGWKLPMYYSTIQTADLDGDGQTEVLARWIDGLDIYQFAKGGLFRKSRIPAMSDNAGFYQPSWYSTIHAAKLDASLGRADILAREQDGIHVFRYEPSSNEWREVGSAGAVRPFADKDPDGTDWTLPKHYLTIQSGDLTGDGVTELVGRAAGGMQVWQWDSAQAGWTRLGTNAVLSDAQGFDQEAYYYALQLVDVDQDGTAELIARAPTGVVTHKWGTAGWAVVHTGGPFSDDAKSLESKRYKSVKTFVDRTGKVWMYGLGAGHSDSGTIQVHQWKQGRWQSVRTFAVPEGAWDRESLFATLTAADVDGDPAPEFLIRASDGLHALKLSGERLPVHTQAFSDGQGWNLKEQYETLQAATALIPEKDGNVLRTLVIGRGPEGLEAYKFAGQWTTASDSGFPQYCATSTDDSANCKAYQAISGHLIVGQIDIRSQYTQVSLKRGDWLNFQSTLNDLSNLIGPANEAAWTTVKTEMVSELGYVATVRGWFDNNYLVLNNSYQQSADLLGQAQTGVSLADSTSVTAKWLEFAANVVAGLARFGPTGPSVSLIVTILEGTYNNLAGSTGDITETMNQLYTDLNNQKKNLDDVHANQQSEYLTNYAKLQQIGRDKESGGFDWATASLDDVSKAQDGAAHGMLIGFYKTLLPSKWQVYWCNNNEGLVPDCGSIYTQTKYDCWYWPEDDPVAQGPYDSEAYIYAGYTVSVNWDLLGKLTGTGPKDLNAIWYMMLLGGDLGWDLPQWGSLNNGSYVNHPDPNLGYSRINHGFGGTMLDACNGNGSTTGRLSSFQTTSQRLLAVPHNTRHANYSEAVGVRKEIDALTQAARAASPDSEVELDLTSPLRAAVKLIDRGTTSLHSSVSTTTPTHLTELFIRRVRLHEERVKGQAEKLTSQAYCLMASLQGQKQPGASCQ